MVGFAQSTVTLTGCLVDTKEGVTTDDDAMLTRMYILANQKIDISTEDPIWRNLCNNYNPTFDAFYVRPSQLQQYRDDTNYTHSSWQLTNNISKGEFSDDESFCVFASHAAATADELGQVYRVDGWFDSHPGVKDLTQLNLTAISELHAADMKKLTQLEQVALPATTEVIENGVFANSPNLRYVDMLLCDSTMIVDDIKTRGLADLGIDNSQTLVYLPDAYGKSDGTNIVAFNGTGLQAETFSLVDDKDYCVPYAFDAGRVQNSHVLRGKDKPHAVCLPYAVTFDPKVARVYKPTGRDGSMVTFEQVADGSMEALKPYVVRPTGAQATLNTDQASRIPASSAALSSAENQWEVPG